MPVGYLVSVALVALVALVPLRAVGNLSFRLGLLLNEVPILGFYWLVADTSLAFAEGDISSAGGWATVGLAALTTAGLAVIAWRGLRARPVLEQAMAEGLGADWRAAIDPGLAARLRHRLPVARILLLPLSRRGRGVERVANIRPAVQHPDHPIDLKRVIAWVRAHGHEYGADPTLLFVSGSSAGAHMASLAALTPNDPAFQPGFEDADTSVTAVIGLNGYYGGYYGDGGASSPLAFARPGAPPFFIAHGDHDTISPVEAVRHFADALGSVSANPVVCAELPGAQHAFDLFHSLRYEMVVDAVEAFTAWVRSRQPRELRVRVERAKGIEPSPRAWDAPSASPG